jgi:hypothetical protein
MDQKLFIENSCYSVEIIDKHDFLVEIQESWRDYIADEDEMRIYIAEPTPLILSKRGFLADLLERYEDDQYEDWAQDMYDDLEDSPIVDQFVEQFNKTAAGRLTYYPGDKVEVDIRLYDDDGNRLRTVAD